MVPAPLGVSVAVLAGVLLVVVVLVGSLIAAAVLQYRRAQDTIAAKRAAQALEADEAAEGREAELKAEAERSRLAFEDERRRVKEDRAGLVRLAVAAAPTSQRGPSTSLLMTDRWSLARPLQLDPDGGEVVVDASFGASGPKSPVALREALASWRPRTAIAPTYPAHVHVTDAIEELEAPPAGRFVNRDCYRVVGLHVDGDRVRLELGRTSYFAVLDEAVPLECDIARTHPERDGAGAGSASGVGGDAGAVVSELDALLHDVEADLGELRGEDEIPATAPPLREVLGDPFDPSLRTMVGSVSTLVLRREPDGSAEFWLHRRRTVGMVGGQAHVVPTGVFQPAIDDLADVFDRDAAPWWTVVRETAEELMGMWNVDERSLGDDVYTALEPLSSIEAARRAGTARPWLVGLGLDPLSLWLEILTVLVVDAATFDAVIGQPSRENSEGTLLGRTRGDGSFGGLPFTQAGIDEALATDSLAPAADGLLRLAWQHRGAFL
jgi:Tfp pilus assembly protein PilX